MLLSFHYLILKPTHARSGNIYFGSSQKFYVQAWSDLRNSDTYNRGNLGLDKQFAHDKEQAEIAGRVRTQQAGQLPVEG